MHKFAQLLIIILLQIIFIPQITIAKSIEEQFKDAENLIDIDQTKDALELLKIIEPETKEQTAKQSYLLGRLYFSLGKFSKADEFYMAARLEDPRQAIYQVGLSKTNYALGKLKLAERYAKRALRDNPDLLEAELVLALIMSRYGEKKDAEKRFLNLIDLQPSNQLLFLTYAKFLEQTDNRKKAISTLEKFIIKNPNTADIHDYLGRLYWFNGQSKLAIEKRKIAAKLYNKSGKFVMTVSITEWVNSVKEKEMAKKKKKEEKKKKALPPKPKQKFTPNPGNKIEPFPNYYYDHPAKTGSGFIVNEGRQILTNRHVIEGAYKIYVRNGFGELRYATIEKISEYDDLALLTLDISYEPGYSLIIPSDYQLKTGQSALVMGFPLTFALGDSSPSLTQGIVSKTTGFGDDPGTFQLTSKLNKGNSGGPIFSNTGELIGVAVQKLDTTIFLEQDGLIFEDVNIAIQIDRVKRFIQSSKPTKDLPKLDLEDLYELKLPSVVMILTILPKEKEIIETTEKDEINKAIEVCQSDYDSNRYPNLSKKQFNEFCYCYINGLTEIYNEEEANHQANYNKPSDKFLSQEEKILQACYEKII